MEVELRDEVGPGLVEVDGSFEQFIKRSLIRYGVQDHAVDAHFDRDRVHDAERHIFRMFSIAPPTTEGLGPFHQTPVPPQGIEGPIINSSRLFWYGPVSTTHESRTVFCS